MFVPPSADEGFERIFHLDIASQSPSYTALSLWCILSAIASSPALASQRTLHEYFRPSSSRGSRGFGTGRGRRPLRGGFANSYSQGADSTSWRRGGGRDSAPQSHSGAIISRGRGRGFSSSDAFSGPGFRGGRAFGNGTFGRLPFETAMSNEPIPNKSLPSDNNGDVENNSSDATEPFSS